MTKIYSALIATLVLTVVQAQDSVSVLFIGNSYTGVNSLPSMVQNLSNSLGDIVTYDQQIPGGTTLSGHAGNATTYTKINSQPWDYVVLQAQSQEPSFPDSQVDTQTIPFAIQLADSVYANKFCSEVLMYMTWGRENGDPQWAPISTFQGMNDRLRSAYMRMADSVQGSVSPVGSAWAYVRNNANPPIQLYSADGSHPSVAGSYLAACTFYASLFRESPVGASYISSLDQVTATYLQTAAAITVLDSLDQWNLRPLSEHTQAEYSYVVNGGVVTFTNESTKANGYSWDFDDTQSSIVENPSHTYAANGTYIVELVAESPCDTDTIEYSIDITGLSTGVGLGENSINGLKLSNLGNGFYAVSVDSEIKVISIFDAMGREVNGDYSTSKIDLSNQAKGAYIIKVQCENQTGTIRVIR